MLITVDKTVVLLFTCEPECLTIFINVLVYELIISFYLCFGSEGGSFEPLEPPSYGPDVDDVLRFLISFRYNLLLPFCLSIPHSSDCGRVN